MWISTSREHDFEDIYSRLKIQFIRINIVAGVVLSWVGVLLGLASGEIIENVVLITVIFTVVAAIALPLLRSERLVNIATYVTLAGFTVMSLISLLPVVPEVLGAATLIATAFLSTGLVLIAVTGLLVARLTIELAILLRDGAPLTDLLPPFFILGGYVTIAVTSRFFSESLRRTAFRAQRANRLLRGAYEVGQITAQLMDRDALFQRTVELVRDRFAYYHVQIFLVDETREYAVLQASTGDIGQQLLNRGHKLAIASQSVIGRATQLGDPVLISNTEDDPVYAPNELLPNTRAELAVPILDGDNIVGALDVQSMRARAFDSIDVQVLQVIASQISVAMRNARLFEGQIASVQENKRLFLEAEANLREIQRLNRQLTRGAWESFLRGKPDVSGVTSDAEGIKQEQAWTPDMVEARQRRRLIARAAETGQVIAVPIVLRGEVLGVIEVTPEQAANPTETAEMVEAVAQRLAISLESTRLFEEAQAATLQEQRINTIVGRYQSANTVDELLQITLAELSESLGAEFGTIRLGSVRGARRPAAPASDAPSTEDHHRENGVKPDGGLSS